MTEKIEQEYEFLADNPNINIKPIIIAVIVGAFFALLNETLLNIALVSIMDAFYVDVTLVQWIATGFMLVMGIVTPISAVLLQWFTTRQLFFSVMFTFFVGTITCAFAPSFSILLLGRIIQAIGTGLLVPLLFNVFLHIFPPSRRGKAFGLIGLVFMFAPAIGPTVSGLIVQYFGWRYLFILVIPFLIISIGIAHKYLINVSTITKPKIDFLSLFYSSIGFGGIVYGFSVAGQENIGFLSPSAYVPIIIGVISLTLFAVKQFKLEEPVVDLRAFRYPMFSHAIIMMLIINMSMFAIEIIIPIFMQGPLAYAPAVVGLALLPGSILSGLLSPIMGGAFDKYGPKILMIPATVLLTITMYLMSQFNMNTQLWVIVLAYILFMISVATMLMPAETNGLNELPKELYPHGTAIMSTLQPVAGAIGVSVFVSMMNARQMSVISQSFGPINDIIINEAMVSGVKFVFYISFIIAVIALIFSFFVYRAKPADLSER